MTEEQKKPKVVVVMPAYNAEKTLEMTYSEIPKDVIDEILLVDDLSRDETVEVAKKLKLKTIVHKTNKGYGGNQKTCYENALAMQADIVVMLHPDYQYDPKLIPDIIAPILREESDMVLASRMAGGGAVKGGMPVYKFISNRFLTFVENMVLRQNLSEFHTGYRAYSRKLLTTIPFMNNSDNFVFDSEVIVQAAAFGFKISEIPCPARYNKDCSSINFSRSLMYGIQTLTALAKYLLFKSGICSFKIFKAV